MTSIISVLQQMGPAAQILTLSIDWTDILEKPSVFDRDGSDRKSLMNFYGLMHLYGCFLYKTNRALEI